MSRENHTASNSDARKRHAEAGMSEHLDAETLAEWKLESDFTKSRKWRDARILVLIAEVERLRREMTFHRMHAEERDAALSAERAAHATTKAELEVAEKDSIIYADKFESATARGASEFKRANDNAEKLRATRERAEAAEAKVARVEALAAYWELTDESGWHEVRAALAGDGDD